jgi:hypothetical protein
MTEAKEKKHIFLFCIINQLENSCMEMVVSKRGDDT